MLGQLDTGELRLEDGQTAADHMKSLWEKKYMWYLGLLTSQTCRNVLIALGCYAHELGCGSGDQLTNWNPLTDTTKEAQGNARQILLFVIT